MRPTNLGSSDFKIEINIAFPTTPLLVYWSVIFHGINTIIYDETDFIPFFHEIASQLCRDLPPRVFEEEIGRIFRENDVRKNMQAGTMPSESVSWTVHEIRSRGLYSAAGCSRCWIAVTGIDSSAPSCARRCLPLYNEL